MLLKAQFHMRKISKNTRILITLLLVAAVLAATIIPIVVNHVNNQDSSADDPTTETTAVSSEETAEESSEIPSFDDNQDTYHAETSSEDPERNIIMPGWTEFTIPKDTTDIQSGVDFFNPDENAGYYYMTFELFVDLEGNGDYTSVYRSGLVEPGNHIQKITLDAPIPAGDYASYVFLRPYSIADLEKPLNTGKVEITLHVK